MIPGETGTIEDYAAELAIAYGMPYSIPCGTVLATLERMLRVGVGIAPPIVVSDEDYEFLQGLLEEGSDDEGES